jgi:hypothetical protein
MLKVIEDTLNKSCLIGLSYFNTQGEELKQNILAGRVIKVDKEIGITIELSTGETSTSGFSTNGSKAKKGKSNNAHFILPTDLSCWFNAPKGEFHTSQKGVKIVNPDYLITWDIYQLKDKASAEEKHKSSQDSEQQWWQWRPRTQAPNVGN